MQTQQANIAQSLYALYETLPDEVQQAFLQELQNSSLNENNTVQDTGRTEEEQKRAIEIYDAYRDTLIKGRFSNDENYDKTIITLSSSGLALSLTAIRFAIKTTEHLYLLKASWWLFGITIFISIIAYRMSNQALDKQLEIAEEYYLKGIEGAFSKKNRYSTVNDWLNMITGVTFITATAFIISFVTFNIN
jgi:hypothetical protein